MQECITEECKDSECPRIILQEWEPTGALVPVCSVYVRPRSWWRRGVCPFVYKHKTKLGTRKKRAGQKKTKRMRGI